MSPMTWPAVQTYYRSVVNPGWERVAYSIVRISIDEDFTTPFAAYIRRNFLKFARRTLFLYFDSCFRYLVFIQPTGILPSSKYELCIGLLSSNYFIFDILVDGCFDGTHKSGAHIDTLSP